MPPKKESKPKGTVPAKGKGTGKSEIKKAASKEENWEKSEASTKSSKSGKVLYFTAKRYQECKIVIFTHFVCAFKKYTKADNVDTKTM